MESYLLRGVEVATNVPKNLNDLFIPPSAISITQWIAPEIIAFFGSIIVFIVLKRSSAEDVPEGDTEGGIHQNHQHFDVDNDLSPEKWKLLIGAGKVLSLLALCATGAIQPSVLSFVYYLVFLGAATWWGCNKELERCELISMIHAACQCHFSVLQRLRRAFANHGLVPLRTYHGVSHLSESLAAGSAYAQLDDSEVGDRLTKVFAFFFNCLYPSGFWDCLPSTRRHATTLQTFES